MSRLKKLIKEALSIPPKKNCDCGGACCSTEITAPILKENKFIYTSISDGLKYHIDNKIPLSNNIYRVDSKKYIKLNEEARSLYSRNRLDISEEDKYFLNIPVLNEGYDAYDEIAQSEFSMDYDQLGPNEQEWVRDEYDNQPSGRYLNEESLSSLQNKFEKLNGNKKDLTYPEKYGNYKGWGYEDYTNDIYRDGFKTEIEAYQDAVWYLEGRYDHNESKVNEVSRPDVPSPSKWWTGDKDALMSYVYWKKGQVPPSNKAQYQKEWEKLANQLQKKYPAPSAIYKKKLNEAEATDEELKKEYANILSKEAHLTRVYMNNRTDENWERLSLFRQKGRGLEKKLAKMGLIDSHLAEINKQIAEING